MRWLHDVVVDRDDGEPSFRARGFTFLEHADVPFDNNLAERAIRPAVIIRKNSYCNRSERGADIQAVLMDIQRELQQGRAA